MPQSRFGTGKAPAEAWKAMKINILRDVGVAICFLVLMLLIAMKVNDDAAKTFTGRYRVVDGDSLALGATRLRLLGIDAPELSQVCTRQGAPWRCGEAAKERLIAFVGAGDIECKGGRKDKYQRTLVTCFNKGLNINREMIRLGMAVTFGDYETEERKAKEAHAGLWASDFTRPVDWRRAHKAGLADEGPHIPSFLERFFGGDS
jgi:endonuclease YncB( thermonuclease family)